MTFVFGLSHGVADIPQDPQPAVVSHDRQVLVFATDEHPQSDTAKRLCVPYDPIPLPDEKVPKVPKKRRGPTSGWDVSAPIEIDSGSEASHPPNLVRRRDIAAPSDSSRPGPSKRPVVHRSVDSQGGNVTKPCGGGQENVTHEVDSDPEPQYDTRQLYPSPIRPRQPIVFSPLQVPAQLLGRKHRRTGDAPVDEPTRQLSVQHIIAELPRGVKRKLGNEATTEHTDQPLCRPDDSHGRLLPAFPERGSPTRRELQVRRAPVDTNTSYPASPRRVASGDPWLHRPASRPPPERLASTSHAWNPPRDVVGDVDDRHLATYGRSQGYVRADSRPPSMQPQQFTRGLTRANPREDNQYAAYEMPSRMDYLQPPEDRRYREEDPRQYAPRYPDTLQYLDQNGDPYVHRDRNDFY